MSPQFTRRSVQPLSPHSYMNKSMQDTLTMAARIAELQQVQRRNSPSTAAWMKASRALQPLFAEMARRQQVNGGEFDWQKWTVA